ncbi:XRE family transcriptional regulator [Cupriavidus pauculus]|uniref:XRE family transcriptional regulator n=1 Tax=Cupriavidus pauculus TaxID=82633 RepID=UPI001C9352D3|nr:XRE family transcriptional regulator [Cupriavidus pauculus]MBY4730767.1 XRE family transcriptional regulator [Cupriavidus pauculus]
MNGQETIAPTGQGILYPPGMELKDWVRDARERSNLTQTQLGEALGVSKANVSAWENGRHEPSWSQMLKIRSITGMPLPVDDRTDSEILEETEGVPPDFAMLRRLDVKASAGAGNLVFYETEKGRLAFRRDFLRQAGVSEADAVVIYADGQSMEPRIPDGAVLLVDTSRREMANNEVHVVRLEHEILVKRLRREIGGGVWIISDNPDKTKYPDILVTPDKEDLIAIIGRVFWMGARI